MLLRFLTFERELLFANARKGSGKEKSSEKEHGGFFTRFSFRTLTTREREREREIRWHFFCFCGLFCPSCVGFVHANARVVSRALIFVFFFFLCIFSLFFLFFFFFDEWSEDFQAARRACWLVASAAPRAALLVADEALAALREKAPLDARRSASFSQTKRKSSLEWLRRVLWSFDDESNALVRLLRDLRTLSKVPIVDHETRDR